MKNEGVCNDAAIRTAIGGWLLCSALLAVASCGGGGGNAGDAGATGGDPQGSNGDMNAADGGPVIELACAGQGGSIEGGWRASKSHVSAFLLSSGGMSESEEYDLAVPDVTVDPLSGEASRVLQEIEGLTRRTYVWPKGKKFYYVLSESLFKTDDSYLPMGPTSAGGALGIGVAEQLELRDGCLVSSGFYTTSRADGSAVTLTNEVTFDRVKGPMPPSDWPSKAVNAPAGSTP